MCPKPPRTHNGISTELDEYLHWITENIPGSTVVVFCERAELFDQLSKRPYVIPVQPDLFVNNDYNVPCTKKIFSYIYSRSMDCKIQIYTNTDIRPDNQMVNLLDFASRIEGDFAITGRRLNIDLLPSGFLSISNFQHWGTDYYIFRLRFPLCTKPYLIGRFFWDSHIITRLVRKAADNTVTLLDASDVFLPLHFNHVYDWGVATNSTTKLRLVDPQVFENLKKTSITEYNSVMSIRSKIVRVGDRLCVSKTLSPLRSLLDLKYRLLFVINYARLYFLNSVLFLLKLVR